MLFYIKSKRALTSLPHLLPPRQSGTHWPEASAADTRQHTAHTESSTQGEGQGFKIGKHWKPWPHAYRESVDFIFYQSFLPLEHSKACNIFSKVNPHFCISLCLLEIKLIFSAKLNLHRSRLLNIHS